ncbi:glycoside hydrolase family 43 protein [Stereum hirsutum FP-91666 SS1]|uniref:glycoside hydrolase family 43 protein n=1 Tax=Stereum hirsutum (strain FP-91666) TaxID=721885 RepID=UPI000444987E|nr:glycoside hydrolase family 43 protein [Stereum hirsutum FP-91666 SS1]EIM86003.1 glycoside hydrolase family 43 protein [Stereum hirsutum FP-91666 SS1]
MKLHFLASFFSLATSLVAAQTYPNPIAGSENISVRDPAIWYNSATGKYYVFATGGLITTYTSTSLNGPWTNAGKALSACANVNSPGNCDLWAPDINYFDGQYVLYYSASTLSSQISVIGVATSPSMEPGTWTDHGEVISSTTGDVYNAIDANLIITNGGLQLSFGSWQQGIYQIGLWPDVETQASALPGTHLAGANHRPAEGGFDYKPPSSDLWFFFFSDGITPLQGDTTRPAAGDEYKVRVGRGSSSQGPFYGGAGNELTEDLNPPTGNIILASHDNIYAPGGQSIFHDPVSGRDVMVYHYVRESEVGGASYLGINYLDFSSGWPVVVN